MPRLISSVAAIFARAFATSLLFALAIPGSDTWETIMQVRRRLPWWLCDPSSV
jgi:hypothetical protein